VRLSDQAAHLEATFVPGAGMLCCSLRHRGEELLAQNAGVAAYVEHGKTMGIPLLYPWANRLAAFEYTVAGQKVLVPHNEALVALDGNRLPIHGVIGGRLRWSPEPVDAAGRSLVATLRWDHSAPELFAVFPFSHDLLYTACLDGGHITVTVIVEASGDDAVPVAFGFHPYLTLPGVPRQRWTIELPAMRCLLTDPDQIPAGVGDSLPAEWFDLAERRFDDGFDAVSESARFSLAAGGRRVTLDFVAGYDCAQVFAPEASSFICFEPMTAPANALRSGDGLRLLAPGERFTATFALHVEELPAEPLPITRRSCGRAWAGACT
jgi:galactose mutarotase-like enzyme